jgi:hypothetical protein
MDAHSRCARRNQGLQGEAAGFAGCDSIREQHGQSGHSGATADADESDAGWPQVTNSTLVEARPALSDREHACPDPADHHAGGEQSDPGVTEWLQSSAGAEHLGRARPGLGL